ncbi:TPA: hypothetical protein EYN98_30105 [Candidatus Poribacteria bacterium]|nr:hypothetical protein [Candidatus Poribacteria bacterium]
MRSIILLTILAAVFVVASQNMKFLLGVTVAGILTVVLLVSVVLEIEPTNKPKKQESSSEVNQSLLTLNHQGGATDESTLIHHV